MDDIVKQAMAKWPNVPHCYGWLALDARGNWRMRDEQTQALAMPGDRITHNALVAFINRNYLSDNRGRWYFQNGPQRVYVNLSATPYIARTDPLHGFIVHTGESFANISNVWLTNEGRMILKSDGKIAMLDDRDLAECLPCMQMDGHPITEEQLLNWLGSTDQPALGMMFKHREIILPVQRIGAAEIASHFGFAPEPNPDNQDA